MTASCQRRNKHVEVGSTWRSSLVLARDGTFEYATIGSGFAAVSLDVDYPEHFITFSWLRKCT